jgi:regulation of enolase protein 1 (concanavalin A-like superfamily)
VSHKALNGNTNWLRVTRAGKDLNCEASADGKAWQQLHRYANPLANDVIISLYAQHGSDKSHTVTFDQFIVEKPKAEKR